MNCSTCQYELSQCLDGRLASGRRALVMDHVAECAVCAGFWRELQAAQALVLGLRRHHVGAEFRDQLFDRIRAGEGTPPAVFRETVTLGAKLRYALSGAAAAAAVLFVATILRRETAPEAPGVSTTPMATTAPATPNAMLTNAATAPSATTPGGAQPLAPRRIVDPLPSANSLLTSVRPLTPDVIAVETAREFESNYRWTSQLLDRGQVDDSMARTVCTNAAEIRNLGRVLLDLRDAKWVNFEPEVDADLRVIVALLDPDRLHHGDVGRETVRTMIAPAMRKSTNLDRLTGTMSITPTFDRDVVQQELLRFSRSWADVLDRIFLVLPNEPDASDFDPRELSRTFVHQDACGPVYVIRRVRWR